MVEHQHVLASIARVICHATDGPPAPSVAIFLAIDGPPGPSMAAMDGPPDHRWSSSQKSFRLVRDGPRGPPCRILQSSVSCSHVSFCWLRLLRAQGSYSSRYCFTRPNMPHACMDCLHIMYDYIYRYTPAYLQLPVYPCMHVHAAIMASYIRRLAAILLHCYVAKLKV